MEKARLTVDMSKKDHIYLKMACAKMGVSIKDFIIYTAFEKIEKLEDEWLAEKARETLRELDEGKTTTVPWQEARKRISKGLSSKNRGKSRKNNS